MYGSLFRFPDVFAGLNELQRELADFVPNNIRSVAKGTFPALNLGATPTSVEIYAFVPGVDASTLNIQIDKHLLTLEGERPLDLGDAAKNTVYTQESFSGTFKRVVSLPDDVDANQTTATYKDGVLHISIARREEAKPKHIHVQAA